MARKTPRRLAFTLAAIMVLAVPAMVLAGQGTEDAGPQKQQVEHQDHDHDHDHGTAGHDLQAASPTEDAEEASGAEHRHDGDHERHRTTWPPAEGQVPDGPEGMTQVRDLVIEGEPDHKALAEEGVNITGSGSHEDPYILENLAVRFDLELKDTVDYYVLKENYIEGTLRLNWNGDKVHVHHNHIRDLRVNENNERVEDSTVGLIEENEIGIVGQIRHFDGIFRSNIVGPIPQGFFDPLIEDSGQLTPVTFARDVALNIDGFNGAIFEDNDINGGVEIDLHGHHHGSCFGCHSHNHGDMEVSDKFDHTVRYHHITFQNNAIHVDSDTVPLRYQDENHAGDDRTANSEPEEDLEGDHVHYTDVVIRDNEITGGPLVVDVFNAEDRYHDQENPGTMTIVDNEVAYELSDQTLRTGWFQAFGPHGMIVDLVKEMELDIRSNTVELTSGHQKSALQDVRETNPLTEDWTFLGGHQPAVVHLEDVTTSQLTVQGNTLAGGHYGVLARYLAEDVAWAVSDNTFESVEVEIDYDDTVESKPNR